jgi:hypothetical protein
VSLNITLRDIRNGFIVQRNKVSWFKPGWAAWIYRKFLSGVSKPVVWDPSIGFSARMLGFASVCQDGTYIGTDPSSAAFRDANVISSTLKTVMPNVKFDLRKSGSENVSIDDESLDFIFTSPPYFDKEIYCREEGQCCIDYPTISKWTENYLKPTLLNAYVALKKDCFAVFNISEEHSSLLISAAESVGFEHVDTLRLPIIRDHFSRKHGHVDTRGEPLLIFAKS